VHAGFYSLMRALADDRNAFDRMLDVALETRIG